MTITVWRRFCDWLEDYEKYHNQERPWRIIGNWDGNTPKTRLIPSRAHKKEIEMNKTQEALAEYAHDAWAGWMQWLFKFGTQNDDGTFMMDADKVERWRRQANTVYADLPEEEKKSDRIEADRMLAIVYDGENP